MKIVIDIPENVYNRFCRCNRFPDEVEEAIIAITDGTPLTEVLDDIKAEIDTASFVDKDTKHCKNANASGLQVALDIIDSYMTEEDKA